MKIIVTGGAGYIGSHVVVELISHGYEPIIIDNMSNTDERNLLGIKKLTGEDIKFYNIDCKNYESLKAILTNEKSILGVIHFAAYKSVEESIRMPEKYYQNNIGSLDTLLNVMKELNIDNLIFSSSCTVYGNPDILPVHEKSIFKKSNSPYAETKQKCEYMLDNSQVKSISLRYFNPIGSHNSSLIGDCSADRPANLIPIICEVASKKRSKLVINGNNYETIDGTCVRDYIHVVDLAKSHVKALQYLLKNKYKDVFNIGTGKGLSVLEAVTAFENANDLKIDYYFGERRLGDVKEIYSDTKKANNLLKWKSEISIDEAMVDAWNWELSKNSL